MENDILKEMRKDLIKNFLNTIILERLTTSSPLCGFDIINYIYKRFGILMSSGTVYSVLYSMERKGLISGQWTEGKRMYALTVQGTKAITAILKSKDEIQGLMQTIFNA